jgi:PDZ domain-containing protein
MKFRIAPLALGIALVCTTNTVNAEDPPLASLTMEHFRDTATVANDPIAGTTTITTDKGFVSHKGILRSVSSDEFLKGVINKKTGQKSFQVDASVSYYGRWRTYATASYQAADGPRSLTTMQLGRDIGTCAVGNCLYTEHVAFTVDEALLRQLAEGYVPGNPALWRYKLIPKVGPEYGGELSSAEIAGFLAKIDQSTGSAPAVQASITSPSPAPPNATSPPPAVKPSAAPSPAALAPPPPALAPPPPALAPPPPGGASMKPDFGIAGMAVAATTKQPNRSGVLVTGIVGDSVADKAGIIVGDILYEFDGRPVSTLSDLATAIAASPRNSMVAIKVHRGIADTTVAAQF